MCTIGCIGVDERSGPMLGGCDVAASGQPETALVRIAAGRSTGPSPLKCLQTSAALKFSEHAAEACESKDHDR
jgi:hypothetical protein